MQQSKPTTNKTIKKVHHLLNYVSSHQNAVLHYHASDMILHIDSDAVKLVLPKARNRIAARYFLTDNPT